MAKSSFNFIFVVCPIFVTLHKSIAANFDSGIIYPNYAWREEYYHAMPIDHFSYGQRTENNTFGLRYLVNDSWWDHNGGPIFVCTGGESSIDDTARTMGLMWDWAPQFNVMLIFIEHRYYGKSSPYGRRLSISDKPLLQYLSVDQAMADFFVLLTWLKKNITGAANSPIITFGGSYGGMLSAWMRIKYPHVIKGAIASSAPILQLPGGGTPCTAFASSATRTFALSAPGCDKAVIKAWDIFNDKAKTISGKKWLSKNFHLCNDSYIEEGTAVGELMFAAGTAWLYMAMFDYPYPADAFVPLPGWPAKEACKYLTDPSGDGDNDTFLLNVQKAMNLFYNYTGTLKCLRIFGEVKVGNIDKLLWGFQGCTELVLAGQCHDHSMFRPKPWDEQTYVNSCAQLYGITPRIHWLTLNYGIERIKLATNIIFSSGDLDPWSSTCITEKSLEGGDPSLVVINIPNGAHHYDLQASNPNDTPEVIEARSRMKLIVKSWLDHSKHLKRASLEGVNYEKKFN